MGVSVAVGVSVCVGVSVSVAVEVGVREGVGVGVSVGVSVGAWAIATLFNGPKASTNVFDVTIQPNVPSGSRT